jgi:hypothetical protein
MWPLDRTHPTRSPPGTPTIQMRNRILGPVEVRRGTVRSTPHSHADAGTISTVSNIPLPARGGQRHHGREHVGVGLGRMDLSTSTYIAGLGWWCIRFRARKGPRDGNKLEMTSNPDSVNENQKCGRKRK